MCVEGSLSHRVARHEDELSVLLAQASLVSGREIESVYPNVGEMDAGDLRWHRGRSEPEEPDGRFGARADGVGHPRESVAHDHHHVEVVADEPDFGVERRVLREVPPRAVRLVGRTTCQTVSPVLRLTATMKLSVVGFSDPSCSHV